MAEVARVAHINDQPPDGRGQGYEPDSAVRKCIEDHAMRIASEHYAAEHFAVENTAARFPFDLRCTRELIRVGRIMHIELCDHIIIGRRTETRPVDWVSLRSLGLWA